ncbi:MAG TPA: Yip1 family protein [Stellaceae bacterium]|nr:Yip1 family protein [Stellaceae bacterium]
MDVDMAVRPLRENEFLRRLKALLLSPRRVWGALAVEDSTPIGLYLRHVAPLAAIPPVAKLLSWSLLFGFISFGTGAAAAVLAWALSLAGVAVLALIAARLARYFGGEERFDRALKLIAYAATASWLGGVFRLVPVLGILSLLASLYSVYLLYSGAPQLLAIPAERALPCTAAIIAAALALYVACAALLTAVLGVGALGMT